MKLAFTTLGCPDWDLDTMISWAVKLGYKGIDFRCYQREINIYELPLFSSGAQETLKRITDAGLCVPCLSTSVKINYEEADKNAANFEMVKACGEMCQRFNAPFMRIFGGYIGSVPREEAIKQGAEYLNRMADIAEPYGVDVLVETHDDWVSSDHIAPLLSAADRESLGIVWDTHHPVRYFAEEVSFTWERIGKWVKYTHWKDSYAEPGSRDDFSLTLFGEGNVPIKEIVDTLKNGGYDGFCAFEWEKMWHPEVADPEEAFPGFANVMKEWI